MEPSQKFCAVPISICNRVLHDMSRARIVAGALLQGDDESEETGGNAGSWIQLVLMLEEVSRKTPQR